ncbi:hypothetical protein ANTRET_LOCUS1372 [Anthophora retusa]
MVKVCNILKKRHLPYYAYTFNLTMQDILHLDIIKAILEKCKEIIKFFRSSVVTSEIFKEEQQAINSQLIN